MSIAAETAQSLVPVPFHSTTLFLVEREGIPYTPLRPIVEGMGLDWRTQQRKIMQRETRYCVVKMTTQLPGDTQAREVVCMPVRKLPAFLASINPSKVRVSLRPTIVRYQEECDDALWNYWSKGRAERPAPSPLMASTISPEEQRHIQNLIEAKVGNGPNRRQLFAQAWNRLKNKFRVPRYEEITPEQYPDVIEYLLKMELRQPLPAPEPKAAPVPAVQGEADLAGAITAHRRAWVPKLDEVEKLTWQAQGSVNRIMSVVCQLAHKTDGNEVAILGNLSQAASDMLRHRGESINAAIGELLSLAAMTFSAIAANLELKNTRKTLRDIRKALPA